MIIPDVISWHEEAHLYIMDRDGQETRLTATLAKLINAWRLLGPYERGQVTLTPPESMCPDNWEYDCLNVFGISEISVKMPH